LTPPSQESRQTGEILHIPVYENVAQCHSKHRVGAVFSFGAQPPTESNIIVFDDFVTTGATMISMKNLLEPLGKNLVFFTGINNKL
jgi:hypoxanthine phosphoribosyltransferase